jgi:long-chain acyl-CoA synthetase
MNVLFEVTGAPADETITAGWMFERIREWAAREPSRCAFVLDHADRADEYSYSDVLQNAARIAAGLQAAGLVKGDRAGILMENVPHWVFALLGILQMGGVAVPLATALPESSLKRVSDHAGCRLIFADGQNAAKALFLGLPVVTFGDAAGGAIPWERFVGPENASPGLQVAAADDPALIIYTSGTTGDPKGVQLTASNLAHEIRGVVENMEISSQHRILSVLPFSHVLPLVANGLGPLCIGAAVVFLSSISPQRIIEAFHKHHITFFVCVPQFFYVLHKRIFSQVETQPWIVRTLFGLLFRIAAYIPNPAQRRKLFGKIHHTIGPDLDLLASGGSRFDPKVAEDLNRLGYRMLQAYGLTETAAAATATLARANAVGTVGRPIRGVSVRIDNPDGAGIGEVSLRGPIIMKGYYKDEESTRKVLNDGWFRSGDLGYLRSDGNLVITGRIKDVIVLANGKNVYPEEIEAHYGQSPYVKELCILGVPDEADEHQGEKLHAVIVPDMEEFRRRGQTNITELIQVDLENLSRQLPSYYRILSFSVRNEALPRTVTRKLKRFEIQQEELERKTTTVRRAAPVEHQLFKDGPGAVVAQLIREAKPDAGPLDVAMNIELDLGFDSLARVELLGLAEARLGVRVEEEAATRIFTLGELVEALKNAAADSGRGKNWKEILDIPAGDALHQTEVLSPSAFTIWTSYLCIKFAKLFFMVFLRLRWSGLEKLPQKLPFILCPNHQSFLDGPLIISTLPKRVIDDIFILGYTDYWRGPVMGFLARMARIVAIDPNINLIQAMQLGALGLRKNMVLLVFPEGTRTIDGKIADFKKGAGILASEINVPVIPVALKGAFEMWPRGGRFKLHPVEVIFGDPIDPRAFAEAADPYTALTEALRVEVKKLYEAP